MKRPDKTIRFLFVMCVLFFHFYFEVIRRMQLFCHDYNLFPFAGSAATRWNTFTEVALFSERTSVSGFMPVAMLTWTHIRINA